MTLLPPQHSRCCLYILAAWRGLGITLAPCNFFLAILHSFHFTVSLSLRKCCLLVSLTPQQKHLYNYSLIWSAQECLVIWGVHMGEIYRLLLPLLLGHFLIIKDFGTWLTVSLCTPASAIISSDFMIDNWWAISQPALPLTFTSIPLY